MFSTPSLKLGENIRMVSPPKLLYFIQLLLYFSVLPSVVPDTESTLTGDIKELTVLTAGVH